MRLLIASLLALSGCASQEVQLPKVVKVPVPVRCIERMPEDPKVTEDADLLRMDDHSLVITLAADRVALKEAFSILRAAALPCVR